MNKKTIVKRPWKKPVIKVLKFKETLGGTAPTTYESFDGPAS
jgi:hypothetical protein